MPNRHRLALRREALVELSRDQMSVVPGGATTNCPLTVTCPTGGSLPDCYSWFCTNGPCASDFQQCHTTDC